MEPEIMGPTVLRKQGQQPPFYARLPGELISLVGATQPPTAIDPQMIDLLRLPRDAEGLQNLEPILVRAADVDPFYRDKSFDVMFLCSIYEYLMDPVAYFRELGKS